MAPTIAWIGLGNMGRGMAKNLVEKGQLTAPLILFNRTQARADKLSAQLNGSDDSKTKVASTIAEAVQASDIIFTCVGDDAALRQIVDAILAEDVTGKLIVDCSTVHPTTTDETAERLTAKGAEFVACPVFGAPAMAESGQLICVLAGPASAVDKLRPYTTGVLGRGIIDLAGERCGKATLLKLIGNTFIMNMVEALGQGHALAETSGLGVDNLHKFVELMFPGPYTAYSNRMRQGDYYTREEPLFAVDLALKDVGHALDLAQSTGAKLPGMELAKAHLQVVKEERGATGDIAGIYGANRIASGLPYENGK